jgi:histidinol dehydrogenase
LRTVEEFNAGKKPIQKIGLYIPGGTTFVFNSFNVGPFLQILQVAKCFYVHHQIKGNINPAILYAANLCGVTKILKVGGIQAIAGLLLVRSRFKSI